MPSLEINYNDLSVTPEAFRLKALAWADTFPLVAYYYDHHVPYPHNGFKHKLAVSEGTTIDFDPVSPFEDLKEAIKGKQMNYLNSLRKS